MAETHTDPFLALARDAYTESTNWFDAGPRREIEADLRQFQGQHPVGSKYLSPDYRARSNLFRPRTRSIIRKNEAIAAAALFDNADAVTVSPEDGTSKEQVISAAVWQEVLNYRLEKSIRWFQTVIGAYQDAMAVGVVCSYQHWQYDQKRRKDQPCIKLLPVENVRFSPNASWVDPVNTSPYFIELIPMFLKDVRARMETADPKTGQPKWIRVPDAQILQAVQGYSDSITLQRERGRADRNNTGAPTDYSLVWVHRNFIEVNGDVWVFYTLGKHARLSAPAPLEDLYPIDGELPYVVGVSAIETHKLYPGGPPRLGKDLQRELNDTTNLRQDNIRFVLNKRYLVRSGQQIDLASIQRNLPGSSTLVGDIEKDVKVIETGDVTSHAYEEQDRINLDMDDLLGTFSQASAQSSRRVVDSKGGLELLSSDASQMGNYQLRTLVETWIKPVLRQVLKYEQAYETDETLFALAGRKAAKTMRLNDPIVIDDALLRQELTMSISVGVGATTPMNRLRNLLDALTALKEILADGTMQQAGLATDELGEEVFTKLGFDGAERFFPAAAEDPRIAELTKQLQDANAKLAKREDPALTKAKIAKILAEIEKIGADKVKTLIEAEFGSMQAAEVVAAVPQVTPIADQLMKAAGYTQPTPPGIDPGFAPGEQGPGLPTIASAAGMPQGQLSIDPVVNKRTGIGFTPGAPGADGSVPPNTSPMQPAIPAQPASPFVGRNAGIETNRPDTAGADR